MIKHLDHMTWPSSAASLIMNAIKDKCLKDASCTVMLTGGRSAQLLYQAWAELADFEQMRNVHFYFGDERCVHPDHPESNFGMVMRTLFYQGVPKGCSVNRIEAEHSDLNLAALSYEQQLPVRIDILLLSVGEDGHIASLFPESYALNEVHRYVVPVWATKFPHDRLTVTPPLILEAGQIFVMAIGPAKAAVFRQALQQPQLISTSPARLVLHGTWILDSLLTD